MPLELLTVPCLKDNYAYLIHNTATGQTAVVDVPEAPPILAALATNGWTLTDILITHHHWDHIDGVEPLRAATGAAVWGAYADAHRLPPLDHALSPGDTPTICGEQARILDVSGHTIGHIALYFPASGYAFTADSLMAAGCGRLFEGTPAQMRTSLSQFLSLPPETLICSGHEYTTSNIAFALTLEPANPALILRSVEVAAARTANRPTVPSSLSVELATNPYLRAHLPQLKQAIGLPEASDDDVFAEIRGRKDRF